MNLDDLYISYFSDTAGVILTVPEKCLYERQDRLCVVGAYYGHKSLRVIRPSIGLEISKEGMDLSLCLWHEPDLAESNSDTFPNFSLWPEDSIGNLEEILREPGDLVVFHFQDESMSTVVTITRAVADELLRRIMFGRRELQRFKVIQAVEEIR